MFLLILFRFLLFATILIKSERKESAESIPYGQCSSECPSSLTASTSSTTTKPTVQLITTTATSSQVRTTATNPAQSSQDESSSCIQLEATLTSSSITTNTTPPVQSQVLTSVPHSLSPVPTVSSPSPYSTPYSGSNGTNTAAAYQNISPTKGHLNLSQYSESVRASSFTQLFHTRSGLTTTENVDSSDERTQTLSMDDFYVIAVSTESDELVVWSVYEQKPVRTLRSIPRPREIHMVDQFRSVVLCNRELTMYDLDRAAQVTKLKGVMNHKMPYYGLHSDDYVVALSRNRMYVNMINLNTGVCFILYII